ncbi:MAG: hypothetical protein LUE64_07395 [Candidatus Gastranaerophilales bacterium]|nr:hypothetical protein [Candidatus Gastranaerophilales bacterium]
MLNNTQNSITTSYSLSQRLKDRKVFDNFKAKPQKVTADTPKGYLIKETPLESLGSAFTDTVHDAGNLGRALKDGKANDTQLGRMNDLGMKIGGGLIAGALMGARSTTNKKLMEVAGFATFFSTMSLWPKVMIDLPTKLRFGFNPHQKYMSSNGNKKQFFQDNQYLPWDVWTKDDINKVADKMDVPLDMKDREEYTKEKMRTIALQDNTLWMLTAGFATPLVTSLVCNRIEEGTRVPIANANLLKLSDEAQGAVSSKGTIRTVFDNIKGHFKGSDAKNAANIFTSQDSEFEGLIKTLKNGEMPENFADKLAEIFDISRFAQNEQISKNMTKTSSKDALDLIGRLFPKSASYDDFLGAISGDTQAKELFEKAHQAAVNESAPTDIKSIIYRVNCMIDENPAEYAGKEWADKIAEGFDGLPEQAKKLARSKGGYSKETLSSGADKLQEIYSNGIKPAQLQMNTLGRQIHKLDGISGEKYNRTARAMVESLGFNKKELELLRNSNETFGDTLQSLITQKIKDIASDDARYHKTMSKLTKERDRFEGVTDRRSGVRVTIKGVFDKLTEKTSSALKGLAAKIDPDGTLEGSSIKSTLAKGITETEAAGAKTNITSVNSMITRMLGSLELERKIQDGSLLEEWAKVAKQNNLAGDVASMSADEIENFYNLCRRVSWQSSYGDMMNKFYTTGNGGFYNTLVETLFSGKQGSEESKNWQNAVRALSKEPEYVPNAALESKKFKDALNSLKWEYKNSHNIDSIGDIPDDVVESLKQQARAKIGETESYCSAAAKSNGLNFADYGESILNTLKKQVNQVYTDKKWMRIFGGATAALVGVTLISQLFFGKVKDAHLYGKKAEGDSFEGSKK